MPPLPPEKVHVKCSGIMGGAITACRLNHIHSPDSYISRLLALFFLNFSSSLVFSPLLFQFLAQICPLCSPPFPSFTISHQPPPLFCLRNEGTRERTDRGSEVIIIPYRKLERKRKRQRGNCSCSMAAFCISHCCC